MMGTLRRAGSAKWIIAIALSGAIHVAGLMLLRAQGEEMRIAGGASGEIAVLGNAFTDALSAGVESDMAEPTQDSQTAAPATTTDTATPATPDNAAEQSATGAATPTPAEPSQAATSDAASPPETAIAAEPAPNTAIAALPEQPEATLPADEAQAETAAPAQQSEAEMAEAVEMTPQEEELAALDTVPTPTARPDYEPPRRQQPAPQPQRQEARPSPQPQSQQQGSGGNAQADARSGQTDGAQAASQASSGQGQASSQGNAATSNYPGQVAARLRRSLRYPPEARRQRLTGEVQVSFVVSSNGNVSNVGIARSSGSSVLDQAAVETVRSAAPFPPIPDGRATWPFTVPLSFTR